jgi:hypothetical protein
MTDLLDASDVQKGEEREDAGILQYLVNLADKVHAAVEEESFIIVTENGVSVGGREKYNVCVKAFEAIEKREVAGGIFGALVEPFPSAVAKVPYLYEGLM